MNLSPLKLAIGLAVFGACGCSTASTYQTARTLSVGGSRLMAGIEYQRTLTADPNLEESPLPLFISYRRGIARKFDLGVNVVWLLWEIKMDGKYQLIDRERFALAIGAVAALGGRYRGGHNLESKSQWAASAVLYSSYDFSKKVSVFFNPQYRLTLIDSALSDQPRVGRQYGASLGTKVGEKWGLIVDLTYLKGFGGITNNAEAGAGAFIDF